jgi:tRNA acetyltransferase TAN1
MINDFNLLATTSRGNERPTINELLHLLREELGDLQAQASRTKIRGLIVAKTTLNPFEVILKFRHILKERPYEFRYALRILPVEKVVPTDLDEIKNATQELAARIGDGQTFRVTVEKRFAALHSRDLIEAAADNIKREVNLEKPDFVVLIEVLGATTGLSLIKPNEVLSVVREKTL